MFLRRIKAVRWLVLKDLQILRRSPLTVALLVIYPTLLAILIGVALSRGPEKPKIAFVNEIPKGQGTFSLGDRTINIGNYTRELFKSIDPVKANTRQQAIADVKSGKALGALVVPADLPARLNGGLTQSEKPELDLYINEEDPIKGQLVDNTINSQVGRASLVLSRVFTRTAIQYANLLLKGGSFSYPGGSASVLGLKPSQRILEQVAKTQPPGSKNLKQLQRVIDFAKAGGDNFSLSGVALGAISEPIKINKTVVSGKVPSLTTYAAALALAISMMFITVILGAASLALEREEGAYTRLVRGPISYSGLLTAKIVLAVGCSFVLSFVLLGVLQLFVSLEWQRIATWPIALLAGGAAFAALGVAIGGITREMRAASLAAIMISFPIIFLALVPAGAVSGTLLDVINAINAAFPFKATVDAMNRALYGAGPSLANSVFHLVILLFVYATIARASLLRFVR